MLRRAMEQLARTGRSLIEEFPGGFAVKCEVWVGIGG
jgi:hypothetical protein